MKTTTYQINHATQSSITIGDEILKHLELYTDISSDSKVALITTQTIQKLHGEKLIEALSFLKNKPIYLIIPDGEKAKTLRVVQNLYEELLEKNINRSSTLISFGGGTTSDVVGFVSGTFMRGIKWIAIPTTLLSQVDAALGGKTGVNFGTVKNVIGIINQPTNIISDVNLLKTVPPHELSSGISEIIKYGIIADPSIIVFLEKKDTRQMRTRELFELVKKCTEIKMKLVEKDPFDTTGTRAILNFGHTVGHAIEALEKGKWTHGESISVGIISACHISEKVVGFPEKQTHRLKKLFTKYGLSITWKGNVHLIMEKIIHDKKQTTDGLSWVLVEDIGKSLTKAGIDERIIFESLKEVLI